MRFGGHSETDGVHAFGGERIQAGDDLCVEFRGDLPGAIRV